MQVHQLLASAAAALAHAQVEDSRLEAELLLRHYLGVSRSGLFLLHTKDLTPVQEQDFRALLLRRCAREPLQHITGTTAFWGLDFLVNQAVLIPRPETEFLLEYALSVLAEDDCRPQHVLDLCTGSGVIATVLAKELPQATVTAVDCSLSALRVARSNVQQHQLAGRVHLLCADLLTAFSKTTQFDLIISNPPYIKAGDIPTLQPEVRDWEPNLALSGGTSGMDVINLICTQAAQHLRPGSWLFLEIGADISTETEQTLLRDGLYEQVRIINDWAGRPRVAQGRVKGC
ncbi:peptide chain release factor N(5)-glutamine methyltransferase [Candidatus Electronema sp. PJ]|uniref:peptide chain release factor N(5)-glutamine methyltransferase n=1 Tax=Candidatus Electronema sp. PJ TaxID=3401572 RepID=UPI003AA9D2E5